MTTAGSVVSLSSNSEITGDVVADSLGFGGAITGSVTARIVQLGSSATITGNVSAATLTSSGTITGSVTAETVSGTGTITGTTTTCSTAVGATNPRLVTGPDHYDLSMPTLGVSGEPIALTVTACADSSCAAKCTAVSGTQIVLASNGGTLGIATFNSSGVAVTTLSYPGATDGAMATVTMPGANNRCCPNGLNCAAGNSCSATFGTALFVFSSSAGGAVATIPAQVAGAASATYYLRAVKKDSAAPPTDACVAALPAGAQSIGFGYECANPSACAAGVNRMSVNVYDGVTDTSTLIAKNDGGPV